MKTEKKMTNKALITGAAIVGVFVAITLLLILEREPEKEEVVVIEQEAYTAPPPMENKVSPVSFSEVTQSAGVNYRHYNGSFTTDSGEESRYMPETMGPGVVLFDYDNDDDMDIFVTNSMDFIDNTQELSNNDSRSVPQKKTSPHLYRNDGDLRFTDVTQQAGLVFTSYAMGAVAADYDGDKHTDLLVTTWGGPVLLRNQGDGRFIDKTDLLKSESMADDGNPSWSTGAVFFDAEGDGDLDLFVANYVSWSPDDDLYSTIDGKRKSYATPDIYSGTSSQLFIQENGDFIDKTEESGLYNEEGKSLGVAVWDFNDDGKLDIAVANDTQPNFLYYNLGDGTFEDRGLSAGIAYDENGKTRAGMGIDIADYANDGSSAIVIGNFSREPVSVFRQEGDSFFRESSQQMGVAGPSYMPLTFGLLFADFDLDGWQDLVMANGHIEPHIQEVEAEISYKQPLVLLGNDQGSKFSDWSDTAGDAFKTPIVGRGLATGDLDNDGDLDIVVTENSGPIKIIRNDVDMEARNYLRIQLHGSTPNTAAIGAMIELHANDVVQRRIVRNGSSYLSQTELVQTFGLGGSQQVDKIIVRWPNGERSEFLAPQINTTLIIEEQTKELRLAARI